MKGTRPAGDHHIQELLSDDKERAENLMIVDLMRSDLGRISEFGTVEVPHLWEISRYTSVLQMTSTVRGVLKRGIGISEIISAVFPPGSVTGAPKKRVMESIRDLEPYERGIYCGCAWLKTPSGDFTASVLIRTFILTSSGKGRYHVGAGITVESEPWRETLELSWKTGPLKVLLKEELV